MAQPGPRTNPVEALRNFFRSFSNASADTRFQNSFGAQISDLGTESRWVVAGTAAEVWHNTTQPLIDDLFLQNESQLYKRWKIRDTTVIRHCWMIGPDQEHANPTIVICCDAKPILKRMMRMLIEDETIKREGFKVLGRATRDLRLTATSTRQGDSMDPPSSKPRSICGTRIVSSRTGREATIGGALIIDGSCYALTVAHVFGPTCEVACNEKIPSDESEFFDSEWALQSDDEDAESQEDNEGVEECGREKHNFSASDPLVPATSNLELGKTAPLCPILADSCHIKASPKLSCQDPHTAFIASANLSEVDQLLVSHFSSSPDDIEFGFDGFDWAIMKLDEPALNYVSRIHSEAIKRDPPKGRVLLCSGNEWIYGSGSGTSCSIKMRGSNVSRNVWSVSFGQTLGPGSSGAWVIDAVDGDIYGVLFAYSASLGEGYIIPFHDILDNIAIVTHASKISLPSAEKPFGVSRVVGNGTSSEDTALPYLMSAIQPHFNSRASAVKVKQSSADTCPCIRDDELPPTEHFTHEYLWEEESEFDNFGDLMSTRGVVHGDLGTFDVFALILNKMIGTGIFTAPHAVFMLVGVKSVAFSVWVVGFIYTLASMLIYIDYSKKLPFTGGELIYLDKVFSRSLDGKGKSSMPGFVRSTYGGFTHIWRSGLFSYVAYAAIYLSFGNSGTTSLQLGRHVAVAMSPKDEPVSNENGVRLMGIFFLALVCLLSYLSSSLSRKFNQAAAVAKIALLIGILYAGICSPSEGPSSQIIPEIPRWEMVPAALLIVLFSFQGWENATFVAAEISGKRQSALQRGSLRAVGVVGVLYLCINMVFLYVTPFSTAPFNIGEKPCFIKFDSIETSWWSIIMLEEYESFLPLPGLSNPSKLIWATLVVMSALGSMLANLYTYSRVASQIAMTNILPWSRTWKWVTWRKPSYSSCSTRVPTGGIILYFITSCILIAASAIFSESFQAASSLNYMSTFMQSLLIVILSLDLWRRTRSSTSTVLWRYLTDFLFSTHIFSALFVLIGTALPSTSPAAISFAGWKLPLVATSIIAIAAVYYVLVFASAPIYNPSTGQWQEARFWKWSVLRIAGVKCEIRLYDDLIQEISPESHALRMAKFTRVDNDRLHSSASWLFGGELLLKHAEKLWEIPMWCLTVFEMAIKGLPSRISSFTVLRQATTTLYPRDDNTLSL